MTTATRTGRRSGRSRPDILRSAGVVIADRGYEEARFADVAKQSGASISTLQYLFGTRENLLIATLRQTADTFLTSTREIADAVADPVDRLRAVVRDMLSVDSNDAQARIDWAVWIEYWRAATRDDELATEAEQTYTAWHGLLAEVIAPLADESLDAHQLSIAAIAMIDGFGIQIVLGHPTFDRSAGVETVLRWLAASLGRDDLV